MEKELEKHLLIMLLELLSVPS